MSGPRAPASRRDPGRRRPRIQRRLAFVPALRLALWGLLVLAVVLTVPGPPRGWLAERVTSGGWPPWLLLLPAAVFGGFVAAFAVYRFALARAGRYHAGKAFLQVGLGIFVLALLFPWSLERYRSARDRPAETAAAVELEPYLASPDPGVRALACEALAGRTARSAEASAAARRLAATDADPRVRAACGRVER